MLRYRPRMIAAAICLAALAGYVDALAYLSLGGFFASFMSGNTTRLGTGVVIGDWFAVRTAGGLVCAFVCGVMIATMLSARFPQRRKPVVMVAVTLSLALAAALDTVAAGQWPLMLLAVAMGAENGVFNREGEVSIGLTYMTGTLVKLGQHLAGALIGSTGRFGWMPYLLLWLGFAGGVILGAREITIHGTTALWLAAAGSGVLTLVVGALTWRGPVSGGAA
jgi:uncharacterized membrane protein YoaK (UPF0700 family)